MAMVRGISENKDSENNFVIDDLAKFSVDEHTRNR